MITEVERALLDGISALEALDVRYAIVGGLAVSVWAMPRATRDVDLYADLDPAKKPQVQRALETHGFEVPAMSEELEQFGVFRSRSRDHGIFLDIFSATGPLGQAILDRRRCITLEGRAVWLISPEDLILLKAFSERERDFEDLVALFRHSGRKVDKPYIDKWAASLDESLGSDEVRGRIQLAQQQVQRRSLKK
ncbi:MAG TPA: nucleotidyltransferase [Pseudomonadota bacterium]|nr:nucleotidyltransferase [Pseudomonadota bacterium]